MRSNGKNLYPHETDHITYKTIGKFKYDFIAVKKDGSSVKLKRSVGKWALNLIKDLEDISNEKT